MVKKIAFSFICLLLLFPACDDTANEGQAEKDTSYLPKVQLSGDRVYVVSDTTTWKGELGRAIKADLSVPYSIMPQDEASYKVGFFEFNDFNDMMKRSQILIFVVDMNKDNNLKKYVQARYKTFFQENPNFGFKSFMAEEEWAKDQLILFLIGQTDQSLQQGYQEIKDKLKLKIDLFKRDFDTKMMLRRDQHQDFSKDVQTALNLKYIHIPKNYRQGWKAENFYWYVRDIDEGYLGLVAYEGEYTDSTVFNAESAIALRDEILGQYITGDDTSHRMMTQDMRLMEEEVINLDNQYAKEFRGLWRLDGDFVGGPFVHYAIYNPNTKKINYFDAFVMAPGTEKKPYLKELETIIRTIKF